MFSHNSLVREESNEWSDEHRVTVYQSPEKYVNTVVLRNNKHYNNKVYV